VIVWVVSMSTHNGHCDILFQSWRAARASASQRSCSKATMQLTHVMNQQILLLLFLGHPHSGYHDNTPIGEPTEQKNTRYIRLDLSFQLILQPTGWSWTSTLERTSLNMPSNPRKRSKDAVRLSRQNTPTHESPPAPKTTRARKTTPPGEKGRTVRPRKLAPKEPHQAQAPSESVLPPRARQASPSTTGLSRNLFPHYQPPAAEAPPLRATQHTLHSNTAPPRGHKRQGLPKTTPPVPAQQQHVHLPPLAPQGTQGTHTNPGAALHSPPSLRTGLPPITQLVGWWCHECGSGPDYAVIGGDLCPRCMHLKCAGCKYDSGESNARDHFNPFREPTPRRPTVRSPSPPAHHARPPRSMSPQHLPFHLLKIEHGPQGDPQTDLSTIKSTNLN